MALIIRIDVDRPYGRRPVARHILSRLSSDLYFPKIGVLGYLSELKIMLNALEREGASAYVFFRRCTLPSREILGSVASGKHKIGLHLENSRSRETFKEEVAILEDHIGSKVMAVSKHGSGGAKFGFHHHPPYEPEKYIEWAQESSMQLFLGNLQDPTIEPMQAEKGLTVFPSAFWLEPAWRDTEKFPVEWLMKSGRHRDVVLLVHPENVLASPGLVADFQNIVRTLKSRID